MPQASVPPAYIKSELPACPRCCLFPYLLPSFLSHLYLFHIFSCLVVYPPFRQISPTSFSLLLSSRLATLSAYTTTRARHRLASSALQAASKTTDHRVLGYFFRTSNLFILSNKFSDIDNCKVYCVRPITAAAVCQKLAVAYLVHRSTRPLMLYAGT